MREISLLAEDLFTFQEGNYSLELVSFSIPEPLVLTKRSVLFYDNVGVGRMKQDYGALLD